MHVELFDCVCTKDVPIIYLFICECRKKEDSVCNVALLLLPLLRAVVNSPVAIEVSHTDKIPPHPHTKVKEVAGLLVSSTFLHLQKYSDF
jgi:hypothetical protein